MVTARSSGCVQHVHFRDLVRFVDAGDVLVINRSGVMAARLYVRRPSGGRAELLVVKIMDEKAFIAMASPLRKLRPGDQLSGEDGEFSCRIAERIGDREVRAEVTSPHGITEILESYGHVPLPPYIQRPDEASDRSRYQTVFADEKGSVAAPTAGLHFDTALIDRLKNAGVHVCSIVLHVGLGTFMPLGRETVEDNALHKEWYSIAGGTILAMRKAKAEGRRVIAVGTTVTRVLETICREPFYARCDASSDYRGETDLFIYPGFEFQIVDQLITNFHLPRSSLLLLVCAFLGRKETLACYQQAIAERYRFFSYGDAMFIR